MIDTGADFTIVAPRRTRELFGTEIDYRAVPPSRRLPIAGIGHGTVDTIIQRVGLLMTDDDGAVFRIAQSTLFAIPQPGDAGRWRVPSVLGRDVLSRFDLHISYDPPNVALTLNG